MCRPIHCNTRLIHCSTSARLHLPSQRPSSAKERSVTHAGKPLGLSSTPGRLLRSSVSFTLLFLFFPPLQVLRENLPSISKPHQTLADTHGGATLQVGFELQCYVFSTFHSDVTVTLKSAVDGTSARCTNVLLLCQV